MRAADTRAGARQRGALTLEFALMLMVFLTLVFLIMEVSRLMYLWNTVQEVARQAARAASVSDFSSAAAMDRVRQQAIFRNGPGKLALGGAIDDSYVRIDYLSSDR
jgi:Flp pilus assembly protein TadG